jgi:gluconate 2-dehydrogenase subunit 3-like protein
MKGKLTRREFLQTSVCGSLVAASGVPSAFSKDRTDSSSRKTGSTEIGLDSKDREILRATIDELIPAADGMPPASQVGAAEYLDGLARQIPRIAETLRKAVRSFTEISVKQFQKDFASLSSEQRTRILQDFERQSSQDFSLLRDCVYEAYYTQPQIWKLIGYEFHATNQHGPQMKGFDESALGEVRKKPKYYREVE